jgi:propane monooxygenase reductase subunit
MTAHSIEIRPSGVRFDCDEETSLLDAATQAGLAVPYGCRKGNCGTCKAQVLDGEVDFDPPSEYSLSQFERDQGITLLCSSYALGDVVLEVDGMDSETTTVANPPRNLKGEVLELTALTHDIRRVRLRLEETVEFRAGQFAQVNIVGTDVWRSYSMANVPSQSSEIEFLIKVLPHGEFSSRLVKLRSGDPIQLNCPHGAFSIRGRNRPLLLIGGGAGMAPLWSMLQDLAEQDDQRTIRFFYGARAERDLFYLEKIASLGARLRDFRFISGLSNPEPGDDIAIHHTGMISDLVRDQLGAEISAHDAYLCGPPAMIDATIPFLAGSGLKENKSIFFDKFTQS